MAGDHVAIAIENLDQRTADGATAEQPDPDYARIITLRAMHLVRHCHTVANQGSKRSMSSERSRRITTRAVPFATNSTAGLAKRL